MPKKEESEMYLAIPIGLKELADQMVSDGHADRLVAFLEFVTGSVVEHYGRQHADHAMRRHVFSTRISESPSAEACDLLRRIMGADA